VRYLQCACGISSSPCTAAACQYTPVVLPSWRRVAVMLGRLAGQQQASQPRRVVSRQIFCSVRSQLLPL